MPDPQTPDDLVVAARGGLTYNPSDRLRPRPEIKQVCQRCKVVEADFDRGAVVSPDGFAHYGKHDGMTVCGIDATGDAWWWPL